MADNYNANNAARLEDLANLATRLNNKFETTKADKAANATAGNFATLDENGNLKDSGVTFATTEEVNAMLDSILGTQP